MHNLLTLFTALGALTQLVWARGLFALDPSQYQWLITFFFPSSSRATPRAAQVYVILLFYS